MGLRNFVILSLAAVLEVMGDAIIREALARWENGWKMIAPILLVLGVAVLGAYGVFVNRSSLDFATTLGLYVVFFAVVGVLAGFLRESRWDWWTVGGVLLIIAGGLVINHGERLRQALR